MTSIQAATYHPIKSQLKMTTNRAPDISLRFISLDVCFRMHPLIYASHFGSGQQDFSSDFKPLAQSYAICSLIGKHLHCQLYLWAVINQAKPKLWLQSASGRSVLYNTTQLHVKHGPINQCEIRRWPSRSHFGNK